ncbi:hypothetical protein E2C01_094856 [Portunus trituberculatus]|uniref:Uncharacterized protein n=1 Tax=Portunus trituberculatus TaxID=210409 RepID=A0A5B7JYB5_PORTR|nr:hypothetical protein [Portunus trituberculatus]
MWYQGRLMYLYTLKQPELDAAWTKLQAGGWTGRLNMYGTLKALPSATCCQAQVSVRALHLEL